MKKAVFIISRLKKTKNAELFLRKNVFDVEHLEIHMHFNLDWIFFSVLNRAP